MADLLGTASLQGMDIFCNYLQKKLYKKLKRDAEDLLILQQRPQNKIHNPSCAQKGVCLLLNPFDSLPRDSGGVTVV